MSAKEKCSGDDLVIASLILESLGTYGKALARRVRSGEFRTFSELTRPRPYCESIPGCPPALI